MAAPLPHSGQIQTMMREFLDEIEGEVKSSREIAENSSEFKKIFRNSLAAHAVMSKLLARSHRPKPDSAKAIITRVPMLVSCAQIGAARIELRRLIELVAWDVYFRDHVIEWKRFQEEPSKGYTRDAEDPIEYCAHRESGFYLAYIKSLIRDEPSTMAVSALNELRRLQGTLNASVHPAEEITFASNGLPLDLLNELSLKKFQELQRGVFKGLVTVIAAVYRERFDSLPAVYRAHFDWLLGSTDSNKLRSAAFGIQ